MTLAQLLEQIEPKNEAAEQETRRRWNACAKPLGSLGLLEDALCQIVSVTGSVDIDLNKKALLIFCADNGVVAQGVTQTGSEVTAMVARGFAEGTTPACRMARRANCKLIPVDMGIKDFSPQPGVLNRRVANGTGDISKGPAMTREQAEQAILAGALLVKDCKEQDVSLLATGEMGSGNTTTASAVASVLLGCEPEAITGRGAGLSDEGLACKKAAICRAIQINQPNPADPLDVLAKLGGFDIAGMCGAFLGGAAFGVPVLMDGVIGAAAALLAVRLCSDAGKAILASHVSAEPAGALLLNALDKHPLITAGLRLGEGTGALEAMPLLDMAQAVYEESNTFENYGMEAYQPQAGAMRGMGLFALRNRIHPQQGPHLHGGKGADRSLCRGGHGRLRDSHGPHKTAGGPAAVPAGKRAGRGCDAGHCVRHLSAWPLRQGLAHRGAGKLAAGPQGHCTGSLPASEPPGIPAEPV